MQKDPACKNIILWISLFSVSMGFLESAVVVYLREIYYPFGFGFPLVPMEGSTALTELFREFATLIMLFSVSFISGKTWKQRFAFFIYSFAIWDIFYYVFLYLLIGWPTSLMTWDILFLIPVTWVGPVIAPIIVSLTMIAIALLILLGEGPKRKFNLNALLWSFFITGSLLLIASFIWDYSTYILENYSMAKIWNLSGDPTLFDIAYSYIPRKFNWLLFFLGEMVIISGAILFGFKKKPEVN